MLRGKSHLVLSIQTCHQWACVLPSLCQIFVPGWKIFYDIYLMTHTCWVDEKQMLLRVTSFKGTVSFWGLWQVTLKSLECILLSPVGHIRDWHVSRRIGDRVAHPREGNSGSVMTPLECWDREDTLLYQTYPERRKCCCWRLGGEPPQEPATVEWTVFLDQTGFHGRVAQGGR